MLFSFFFKDNLRIVQDHFELKEVISEGSYGIVFKAEDLQTREIYAVTI